ncbi:MAG: chloride channel protein [Methylotenera sp.]|uniref:chloride channel protein n=1 Tax=Methylotenera sp. TaxID=2051956 RepID=UPI0024895F84|nr:chloride channel protein [Methylotenera sp.]MDI1309292.1 chloride channel protein [Methylotenera sp.]
MPTLSDILATFQTFKLTNLDAWRGRLIVWTAAATAGLIVVLFAKASEHAIAMFFLIQKSYWWAPIVLTPLAGMLIVWITNRWFTGAGGSGIPQTIAALHVENQNTPLSSFVSLKLAFGKVVLGVGALAAGFSAGREGPSVQVGASIMHAFRRFLPVGFSVHPKHLILAGGAAGISAAFNTPLAGVVFAIEELGRRFEQKTNGVVITAIVLAGLVSISIQGNYTYFGNLAVGVVDRAIILPVIVCGVVCGLFGGVFSRTLIESSTRLKGRLGTFRLLHPLWWAGFCGLLVAMLGVISAGAAHGSGYAYTQELLKGGSVDSWQYAPVKYLATIFTYLSGIPGGIFAPSLSIGAGIGHDLLPLFGHNHLPTAIIALCMAGFLSAATQAPLTSFIIVMEMIDGHEMVISLMAVTMIASLTARIFSPPLYATLADIQLTRVTN